MPRLAELPPGPRFPRAVQTLRFGFGTGPFLDGCARQYGDRFTLRLSAFLGTSVYVSHPDDVREVFTADPERLCAGESNELLAPLMGPASVLLASGAEHRRKRRMLLPPFHRDRIAGFRDVTADLVDAEIDRWMGGRALRLRPRFQAVTLDVILRVVFGLDGASATAEPHRRALRALVREGFRIGPALMMFLAPSAPRRRYRPWSRFQRALDEVDALLLAEIRLRRRARGDGDDVLSMLVAAHDEDGEALTDGEIRDQLVTLLLAGHETSATSLSWAVDLLLHHPEQLDLLRAAGDDPRFARAVACETLRLRPPLYSAGRRVMRPWALRGQEIPVGTTVTVCAYLLHRRPDVWERPEAFLPERFLDAEPDRYAWAPFGGGTRRCLGAELALMEMEVALMRLAARVELRPVSGAPERAVRRNIIYMPARDCEVEVQSVDHPQPAPR
jgi:cytochrome P450